MYNIYMYNVFRANACRGHTDIVLVICLHPYLSDDARRLVLRIPTLNPPAAILKPQRTGLYAASGFFGGCGTGQGAPGGPENHAFEWL